VARGGGGPQAIHSIGCTSVEGAGGTRSKRRRRSRRGGSGRRGRRGVRIYLDETAEGEKE